MRTRASWTVLLVVLAGCGYNKIQAMDERVKQTRANIDTELLRRNDLIPNLVATVQGAAEFEKQTYTQVAQARAGLTSAANQVTNAVKSGAAADELSRANAQLTDQLRMFINVAVEAYPTLRANQNFIGLQDELTSTENRIAVARQDYNESVAQYNTYIRQFPQVLTAKVTGAERAKPFEAPASAATPPRVQFPGSMAPAPAPAPTAP